MACIQVLPRIQALLYGWAPLQQPTHGVDEFKRWRPLLESDSARHAIFTSVDDSNDPYGLLVWEALLPYIRFLLLYEFSVKLCNHCNKSQAATFYASCWSDGSHAVAADEGWVAAGCSKQLQHALQCSHYMLVCCYIISTLHQACLVKPLCVACMTTELASYDKSPVLCGSCT